MKCCECGGDEFEVERVIAVFKCKCGKSECSLPITKEFKRLAESAKVKKDKK